MRKSAREQLIALTENLYGSNPPPQLFHYTSLTGFLGIVANECLWATEIRYMNDAEEMGHFGSVLKQQAAKYAPPSDTHATVREQMVDFLGKRMTGTSQVVFVLSLSEEENLLSQWRSYTKVGQGLSIGFNSEQLKERGEEQKFLLGKCVYDQAETRKVATAVVQLLIQSAVDYGPKDTFDPKQSYWEAFNDNEVLTLAIGALFKNPAFQEEKEWRLASVAEYGHLKQNVKYRAGAFAILPYVELALRKGDARGPIEKVIVGPTIEPERSQSSVLNVLQKSKMTPDGGWATGLSHIPLRNV